MTTLTPGISFLFSFPFSCDPSTEMATLESRSSILSLLRLLAFIFNIPFTPQSYTLQKPPIFPFTPTLSLKFPLLSSSSHSRKLRRFEIRTAVQEVQVEAKQEETPQQDQRTKLFVLNLPWYFTVADIKNLFSECGAVIDVETIRQKSGKSRGYAFVTMASGEEAHSVIEKFDSREDFLATSLLHSISSAVQEVLGRIIKVEFAKRFKQPSPPPPPGPPPGEARHKLYVSNLAWKVRSNDLREFFAANFSSISARIVFDTPLGRSAGYGFVSFATREEAETAISDLNVKELLGRPIGLKFSSKSIGEPQSKEENTSEDNLNSHSSAS